VSLIARAEGSARVLAGVKLVNVALILLWGFAVTYVFIRVLPLDEFRAFLLLVAFGNFTISAEFGLTSIVYARLRRYWLKGEGSDYAPAEMGVIMGALLALIAGASLLLIGALATDMLSTAMPTLFLLFFLLACLNLPGLLIKRALAASDANLVWEMIDCARRVVTIGLLIAVLGGLDLGLSVALQLGVTLLAFGLALGLLHRRLGMRARDWSAWRVGGAHVRAHYLRDLGASVAFTLSDIAAYNAPYFLIVLATREARPLLIFDFLFKMSRALSMTVRALVEAALPRITRAYHAGDGLRFRQILWRALAGAGVVAAGAAVALLGAGGWLFRELFDGKAAIGLAELALIAAGLAALSIICVSVYVQSALGRFGALLRLSLPFLAGSLASVPLAAMMTGWHFDDAFLVFYVLTLVGAAAIQARSLRGLARSVGT
jgi:O-antigen/teichoic acid export membrane protein